MRGATCAACELTPHTNTNIITHTRYNSTYGVDHLVNWTVNATTLNNFSGSWFDSFSPSIGFKGMLDSGGKSAPEWNLDGDTFVTMEFALASQHDRLDRIWKVKTNDAACYLSTSYY